MKNEYANWNVEATDHTSNNRLLFLCPHTFHSSLIKKELEAMLALSDEEQREIKPFQFLREKVLSQITSVQVLVFGNTSKEQAVEFCNEHIVKKFPTVASHHGQKSDYNHLGCIYTEATLLKQSETISANAVNRIKAMEGEEVDETMKEEFSAYQ